MNKKKETTENVQSKKEITDQELGEASGGWHIVDTCQNKFVDTICFKPAWIFKCGHLDAVLVSEEEGEYKATKTYRMGCGKGCFTGISYIEEMYYGGGCGS